jgi:large subunit ribosomal protein L29
MKAFALRELRQLSDAELKKRIEEEEENLANVRFQKVFSQTSNPMKTRHIRKDIALMKTLLREREIQRQSEQKPLSQTSTT